MHHIHDVQISCQLKSLTGIKKKNPFAMGIDNNREAPAKCFCCKHG